MATTTASSAASRTPRSWKKWTTVFGCLPLIVLILAFAQSPVELLHQPLVNRVPSLQLRLLRDQRPQDRAGVAQQLPAVVPRQAGGRPLQLVPPAGGIAGRHFTQRQPRRLHRIAIRVARLPLGIGRKGRLETSL